MLPSAYERGSTIPIYWHNKASDLLKSAKIIWDAIEKSEEGASFTYSTYLMLMGMSFEVLLKAHCVAIESENQIDPLEFKDTHNLTEIASKAGLRFDKKVNKVFSVLTEYVIWNGRYPVPKKENNLTHHTKNIYNSAYDKNNLGEITVFKQNDNFSFPNLLKIWRNISDDYLEKYDQA
ncbi:hypothetical protein AWH61_13185 [Alteromonas sp. W12]|uniref:hypothetical protein n=1 Tax=Alteromonas sp. W12 TaxID=1772289 RepID=UPI0009491435|nr:hypothetical protein [Alteromonas sp. W12]OLF74169.1 hypothetical protein AWH61_13185 [Alteromonas sp. W12]